MKFSPALKYNALGMVAATIMVTFAPGCGTSKSTAASATAPAGQTPAATANPVQQSAPAVAPAKSDSAESPIVAPAHNIEDAKAPVIQPRRFEQTQKSDGFDADISDAASDFDPYSSLDSDMGEWIVVGGQKYFVPNNDGDSEWQPYQHGYWNYDVKFNWTWVSYDPWGSVTDHYGIWRHHRSYGWIWLPFRDHVYHPHCVTWFDDGDYVGWYPYFSGYAEGYAQGEDEGFNDGYWEGFRAVQDMQKHRNKQNFFGFTVVKRADVTSEDIFAKRIRNSPNLIFSIAFHGHSDEKIRNHEVGLFPGGDRDNAYNFLEVKAQIHAKPGRVKVEKLSDGKKIVQPVMDHAIPADELKRRKGQNKVTTPDNVEPNVLPIFSAVPKPAAAAQPIADARKTDDVKKPNDVKKPEDVQKRLLDQQAQREAKRLKRCKQKGVKSC